MKMTNDPSLGVGVLHQCSPVVNYVLYKKTFVECDLFTLLWLHFLPNIDS